MHPRQPLTSLFLWVDDEQLFPNAGKGRFADNRGQQIFIELAINERA
jgi:hypothetical protein